MTTMETGAPGHVKRLQHILHGAQPHWVGDGFPVRTLFAYSNLGSTITPFLLFDYAGPMEFSPTEKRRGVSEHPHRGFETVTVVYSGEVEHHDSAGNGGIIGPGDVQWMTAASGVLHEEFHSPSFSRRGGLLEMVQLWVNLPAKEKMSPPRYQSIANAQIPALPLPGGHGSLRLIAGEFAGAKGPAKTFTPIHVWDLHLDTGSPFCIPVPEGYTTLLAVLHGLVKISRSETIGEAEVGLFDRAGNHIRIEGAENVRGLLLCGEPIDEPIAGSGPFVMNTPEEIKRAITDYQTGRLVQTS